MVRTILSATGQLTKLNGNCRKDCSHHSKLDHEIENFNSDTGALTAWVRIPSLSGSTNTEIYIYYGNGSCPSQENANGVWDANYQMVQHLEETSGTHQDSTSNNNDGTGVGSLDQNGNGKIES